MTKILLIVLSTAAAIGAPRLASIAGDTVHVAADAAVRNKVYLAAQQSVGKQMWKGYGLPNGKLGCAAALCNVLKDAGVAKISSPVVTQVRKQLLSDKKSTKEIVIRNGPKESLQDSKLAALGRPGDIVLAFMTPPTNLNGGPNAHCGILATDNDIFTNDWNDGVWKKLNIHLMFDYYPYLRLVRRTPNTVPVSVGQSGNLN